MQLNNEVFPAPFGPMSAAIPPPATSVETPLIAFTPPNERCTSSILSSDTQPPPCSFFQKIAIDPLDSKPCSYIFIQIDILVLSGDYIPGAFDAPMADRACPSISGCDHQTRVFLFR